MKGCTVKSINMKTELLRRLRKKIPSDFSFTVKRNPIDVRNEILNEVHKIREKKNIKRKQRI